MEIPAACRQTLVQPLIVLSERRSSIAFTNAERRPVERIRVDGCAIMGDVKRCDFLLILGDATECYVELKGSDVEHAFEQLEATILALSRDPRQQPKRCYVVTRCCPLSSPRVQRRQVTFRKRFSASLSVRTSPFTEPL